MAIPGDFNVSTDKFTCTNASNAFCLFVSAGTRAVEIILLEIWYSNANGIQHQVRIIDSDLNLGTNINANITNMVLGTGQQQPSGQVNVTYTIVTTSPPAVSSHSIPFDAPLSGIQGQLTNMFVSGLPIIVPAGQSGGIAIYMGNTAAGTACIRAQWREM